MEEAWDRHNILNENTQSLSCSASTFIMLIKFRAVPSRGVWKLSLQINECRLFTTYQEAGYRSLIFVLVQTQIRAVIRTVTCAVSPFPLGWPLAWDYLLGIPRVTWSGPNIIRFIMPPGYSVTCSFGEEWSAYHWGCWEEMREVSFTSTFSLFSGILQIAGGNELFKSLLLIRSPTKVD